MAGPHRQPGLEDLPAPALDNIAQHLSSSELAQFQLLSPSLREGGREQLRQDEASRWAMQRGLANAAGLVEEFTLLAADFTVQHGDEAGKQAALQQWVARTWQEADDLGWQLAGWPPGQGRPLATDQAEFGKQWFSRQLELGDTVASCELRACLQYNACRDEWSLDNDKMRATVIPVQVELWFHDDPHEYCVAFGMHPHLSEDGEPQWHSVWAPRGVRLSMHQVVDAWFSGEWDEPLPDWWPNRVRRPCACFFRAVFWEYRDHALPQEYAEVAP